MDFDNTLLGSRSIGDEFHFFEHTLMQYRTRLSQVDGKSSNHARRFLIFHICKSVPLENHKKQPSLIYPFHELQWQRNNLSHSLLTCDCSPHSTNIQPRLVLSFEVFQRKCIQVLKQQEYAPFLVQTNFPGSGTRRQIHLDGGFDATKRVINIVDLVIIERGAPARSFVQQNMLNTSLAVKYSNQMRNDSRMKYNTLAISVWRYCRLHRLRLRSVVQKMCTAARCSIFLP